VIEAWRISKSTHSNEAFSGEGARRFGGRWNFPGTACVYLADSLALAALELFVHLGREGLHIKFVSFRVLIPNQLIETVDLNSLPKNWNQSPPVDDTQKVGTDWIKSKKSVVLKVPSATLPGTIHFNYILNIHHKDYPKIRIEDPKPFSYDPRMWE
jgi:RES domain-containing protein